MRPALTGPVPPGDSAGANPGEANAAETGAAETDAVLIERSCGQPQQFATIFDRHADQVYHYVARRIGAQAAADVVAEVFLVAFRNRHRYDQDRADARPWLYGIATRLIRAYRRAEQRRLRNLTLNLTRLSAPDSVDSFEERSASRLAAQQLGPRLARALRRLSAADRDLLLLVAWAELTYEQAAQALEIPIGTVSSRLHRIRKKVRRTLGGTDPSAG